MEKGYYHLRVICHDNDVLLLLMYYWWEEVWQGHVFLAPLEERRTDISILKKLFVDNF